MSRKIDNVTSYVLLFTKKLKAVYLSFRWFNDSLTRGFELVTRGFELITHGIELVTRGFELVTRGSEVARLSFNSCFQLVHLSFQSEIYQNLWLIP